MFNVGSLSQRHTGWMDGQLLSIVQCLRRSYVCLELIDDALLACGIREGDVLRGQKSNREMGVAALVEGCLCAATQAVVSLLGACEGLCYYWVVSLCTHRWLRELVAVGFEFRRRVMSACMDTGMGWNGRRFMRHCCVDLQVTKRRGRRRAPTR